MEWWQLFGILFLFFVGLYIYSAIAKESDKNRRREELLLMAAHEDGQWQHPDDLVQAGKKQRLQPPDESEDDGESFVTRVPKTINKIINQKLTKATLKDKTEIGDYQVKHINNANDYADGFFRLQTKSKTNHAKGLELDKQIVENENALKDVQAIDSLRTLKNEDKKLDFDISIAKKKALLNNIKTPPEPPTQPSSTNPKEQRAQDWADLEGQISELEDTIKKISDNNLLSADDKQTQLNQAKNKLFKLYQKRMDLL